MDNKLAIQQKEEKNKVLVFKAQKQFEASNEYQMNFNREAGFAIQILTKNDFLASCTPESIKNSVVNVSLTGLTLNPALKYAYLIPRGKDCILDISYIGMIKILTDAGAVKNIDTGIIYSNDKFEYRKGTDPFFSHTPNLTNQGDMIAAYAIAYFRDGGQQFDVMSKEEILKVRATSESYKNEGGRKYSPWVTWEAEMWKKTVLKRLFKILPKTQFSEKLIAAISHDYENEINDLSPKDKYDTWFNETSYEDVSDNKKTKPEKRVEPIKPIITEGSKEYSQAVQHLLKGGSLADISKDFEIPENVIESIIRKVDEYWPGYQVFCENKAGKKS